jgi:malate synthase
MGIMDEERRTSVNLKACINAARERVAFINTGFLDRTGDEMHTSMEAGPMVRKGDMKQHGLDRRYERNNVDGGLECGLRRQGADRQGHVGDARPDGGDAGAENRPSESRRDHRVGAVADCGDLHATCTITRSTCSSRAERNGKTGQPRRSRFDLLTIPVLGDTKLDREEIQQELDNNAQGILGYVVRWIDQGVGCSKVPDITTSA